MCYQEEGSYTFVFQFRDASEGFRASTDMCCQEKGSYTFVFQFRDASEGPSGHLRILLSGERLI